ncbi:hypothetical protein BFX06_08385 [Sulfobacillus thermosulfidooxidans]|nr:hypothetical protein BFX05_01035 [Sulfobacillus thermosulfidooxidans]OLZ14291.1 hypothetical protein BFX06_08385 [Sulfobacillus thermosulfidooxidans]OLZ19034.1 hypothetical protein BFX07_04780 [Sulfobacillus thermosulfidooxidans]
MYLYPLIMIDAETLSIFHHEVLSHMPRAPKLVTADNQVMGGTAARLLDWERARNVIHNAVLLPNLEKRHLIRFCFHGWNKIKMSGHDDWV